MNDAPEKPDTEEQITLRGKQMGIDDLAAAHAALRDELAAVKVEARKATTRWREEESLKPFQAELIKLQKHLELTRTRVIILFEGRDAAGKGGTIRRVTRYMNEKHYRVV
ncbi:MAG TPA: hypothetical protein VLM84_05095, partial [Chromatiaceae bacterium]|nr:hypothetical protein [Chromatiaceae bacterium]